MTSSAAVTRQAASDAVTGLGWRYLFATLGAGVPVTSTGQAVQVTARLAQLLGDDLDEHLRIDLRPGLVGLSLSTRTVNAVTGRDVELAGLIATAVSELGLTLEPTASRGVQTFEIAIDALDIARVRPFWLAVLGYTDDPQEGGQGNAMVDPYWQGPALWFQQMDEPRDQRNRIHFDISVAHDEAPIRMVAALAAGGRLVSSDAAPSFWVLADPEGNEVCVCTWQGRD